jgi:hypothetical protein
MLEFSGKLEGTESLKQKLLSIEKTVAGKILRKALREGARIIQKQCILDAPSESGITRKAIKVRAGKKPRSKGIRMLVQISKKAFSRFPYAFALDRGRLSGKRKSENRHYIKTKYFHWLERAFEKTKVAAYEKIQDELRIGLEEATRSKTVTVGSENE